MATEPTPEELATIRKTAVLVVALLTYPKLAPRHSEECRDDRLTLASEAFDYADAFVCEAERRGMDPASLISSFAAFS